MFCFTLGVVFTLDVVMPLGDEICALTPPVGTNGSVPSTLASLILIDRQLDIVTPALHQAHVLDRIFGSLSARSSNRGRSQSTGGRTPKMPNSAPAQQHQSPVHVAVSPTKHARQVDAEAGAEMAAEAGAEMAADAGQGFDREVAATADGESSQAEVGSEAAMEGSSEGANEGWSDLEEASASELPGALQPGTADVHEAQQQQQQQQPQRPTFSLRYFSSESTDCC